MAASEAAAVNIFTLVSYSCRKENEPAGQNTARGCARSLLYRMFSYSHKLQVWNVYRITALSYKREMFTESDPDDATTLRIEVEVMKRARL